MINIKARQLPDKPVLLHPGDIVAIILGAALVVAGVFFWLQNRKRSRF